MTYSKLQFIAYETPTDVTTDDASIAASPLAPVGNDEALKTPARAKLCRFSRVAAMALSAPQSSKTADTLKVLVAPEFYFRPRSEIKTDRDSYAIGEGTSVMSSLDKMFKNPAWENWVIVPGTVLWNQVPSNPLEVRDRFTSPTVFWNTAMLITGGPKGESAHLDKAYISRIDGPSPKDNPALTGTFAKYMTTVNIDHSFVKAVSGRSICVEICLDHAMKYLKAAVVGKTRPAARHTDLHILTSHGMSIQPDAVVALTGGYVLHVDGYPSTVGSRIRKVTKQATDLASPAVLVDPNIPSHVVPLSNSYDRTKTPVPDAQQLRIYDALPF